MTQGTNGAWFRKGLQNLLKGVLEWDASTAQVWAASLIDLSDWASALPITAAVDNGSGLIRLTSTGHGLSDDDQVHVTGMTAAGVPNADGTWAVDQIDANTFDLKESTFSGAFTAGGEEFAIKLDVDEFLNDVTAAAVEETVGLSEATFTNALGVIDAADITFPAASGDPCGALIIHRNDTPAGTNDQLLLIVTEAPNFPVTLNGGNVQVTMNDGTNKIASL